MLEIIATACAGFFAGAAGYISLVEHWARLQAGPAVALAQFRPGFPRARAVQASLAVVGGSCAFETWLGHGQIEWLVASVLLFSIVGFTLLVILPVYNKLLDPDLSAAAPEAPELLLRWGRLHLLRSIAGATAFVAALIGLSRAAV